MEAESIIALTPIASVRSLDTPMICTAFLHLVWLYLSSPCCSWVRGPANRAYFQVPDRVLLGLII